MPMLQCAEVMRRCAARDGAPPTRALSLQGAGLQEPVLRSLLQAIDGHVRRRVGWGPLLAQCCFQSIRPSGPKRGRTGGVGSVAMKKGTFYAVGVGPGDPELLTQKALRILQGCAVIAAPRGKGGAMTALSIAARAVDLSQKTIVPLPLAMERGAAARRMCHEEAAAVLAAHLDAGRDTAMVCLGDTSVYASSSYFLALLRERGYAVKQIPGVPSFCAAAAALGRSLTEMDAPLHIVPAGTTDLEEALAWPGSKVLMKSGEEYGRALQMLRDKGLDDRAALAVNCGLPEEMLCATLRCAPARSGYFTTFLVPADADDASS